MFPDTCQLCTKEQYLPYIREALGIRRGGNLSASSMEVLAVIAYAQPVTRSYIDTVRGVDSSYAVNALLDKELIEACGRLDAPGRPMLYAQRKSFCAYSVWHLSQISHKQSSQNRYLKWTRFILRLKIPISKKKIFPYLKKRKNKFKLYEQIIQTRLYKEGGMLIDFLDRYIVNPCFLLLGLAHSI